jgi:hypothetical protein
MWNRVQLLIAVQGAVFASNYALANKLSSLVLFVAAIVSTLYLAYIWDVDRMIRNKHGDILAKEYDVHITYS